MTGHCIRLAAQRTHPISHKHNDTSELYYIFLFHIIIWHLIGRYFARKSPKIRLDAVAIDGHQKRNDMYLSHLVLLILIEKSVPSDILCVCVCVRVIKIFAVVLIITPTGTHVHLRDNEQLSAFFPRLISLSSHTLTRHDMCMVQCQMDEKYCYANGKIYSRAMFCVPIKIFYNNNNENKNSRK